MFSNENILLWNKFTDDKFFEDNITITKVLDEKIV